MSAPADSVPVSDGSAATGMPGRGMAAAIVALAAASVFHAGRRLDWALWLDEIWVARFVRDGVVPDTPLPPLFRAAVELSTALGGFGESFFRLPSLFAFAVVVLLPIALLRIERALIGANGALAVSLLLASSSPLLFYAAQTKQYTLEAAFAAALLVAWLQFDASPGAPRALLSLALLAAVAPLAAISAPFFALPLLGAAMFRLATGSEPPERVRPAVRTLLVGAAACLAVTAAVVVLDPSFVAARASGSLASYWQSRYWDGSLAFAVSETRHWVGQALHLLRGGTVAAALLVGLFLAKGSGSLGRRASLVAAAAAPPLLVLVASRFELYPYGEVRLMLFALPGLFVLIAAGLETLARIGGRSGSLVAVAALALFVHAGWTRDPYDATYMRYRDARATIRALEASWRPGFPIEVSPSLAVEMRFYAPQLAGDLRIVEAIAVPAQSGDRP